MINEDSTETIDLQNLGLHDVSKTGSFVLGGLDRTAIGQLLSAIPMPILLVSLPDAYVRFLNPMAVEFLEEPGLVHGGSLFNLVKVDAKNLQRVLNRLFVTRKQQLLETWITTTRKSKWVRINLRSLRLSSERLALILLQDLTHEKVELGQRAKQLERQNQLLQAEITQRRKLDVKLKQACVGTIRALSKMSEIKDPHTAGHQRRVTSLAVAVAGMMGMKQSEISSVAIAAEVHDIGKLRVPVELLSKPGDLSEAEFSILKEHPLVGYDILKEAHIPRIIPQAVLQHHERMNGRGYPEGLKGNSIVLEARIIAVADVVEAMSSHRTYRPAPGVKEAAKEIKKNRGILYDADVVDACLRVLVKGFRFQ